MEYYIGQIFEGMYPAEAAVWCNENGAVMVEIEPAETEEGTIRRFQIQEVPEHVPTEEEQRQNRAREYQAEVDPITSHISRLRDAEQTEEIIAEIAALIVERDEKVAKIKEKYPYPVGE